MPHGSGMTAKHFLCVNVIDLDKPVVLWETPDCTGKSCFIPTSGHFNTWSNSDQGNCVQINPNPPVDSTPCLAAAQGGPYPFQGGLPRDGHLSVGGDYGLPVSFQNSHSCDNINLPPPIPLDNSNPPDGDYSQAVHPDTSDLDGIGPDDLDADDANNKRRARRLRKRANPASLALRKGRSKNSLRSNIPYCIMLRC